MALNYKALDWQVGDINLPGIKQDVYAIAKRDIVSFPALPDAFTTTMGELVTYTGSFVLAATKKWQKIGVIVDKSPVESKSQGTRPSKTFLNTATFQHAGVEEDATGFVRQANNDDLVYLVETKKGKFRVIGNDMYQTDTTIDQKLGGAATDEMGTTLVATVTDLSPAPFYTGEIVTEDGIINPTVDKVLTVTFTPDGGTIVAGTGTIALATATAGATIKYSVDGGAWLTYSTAIDTTGWGVGNHTVIAIASKAAMSDSVEAIAIFHV